MSILTYFVIAFGAVIALASLYGMIAPRRLTRFVSTFLDKSWAMVFAVGVRLVLGAVLILAAPATKFPLAFQILGGLALLAAVLIPFVGRARLAKLIGWFESLSPAVVSMWCVFGVGFGGFLIYGAL